MNEAPVRRRRSWWRVSLASVAALGVFLAAWAFWWEPSGLRLREYSLRLSQWDSSCDGLRIAVLSDLHVGSPFNGLEHLNQIVSRTRAARPDLVLLPGDFVVQGVVGGSFVDPEAIARSLAEIGPRLGAFAVLGNHDWWFDGNRVIRAFEAAGITVLENRAFRIEREGCSFWLAGIADYWEGQPDIEAALAGVSDGRPVVALTHNPDVFPQIPARVALTVAGHTHGGQVSFPLVGAPIVPSRFGQRYVGGHVIEEGRHLFVATGLGTSILPVRFRVPPEISVIGLHGSGSSRSVLPQGPRGVDKRRAPSGR